jgi:hypothetical protein
VVKKNKSDVFKNFLGARKCNISAMSALRIVFKYILYKRKRLKKKRQRGVFFQRGFAPLLPKK